MLEHVGVALPVDKRQGGATAPDVVAIGGTVAVVPVPVLVFDCLVKRRILADGFRASQQGLRNDPSEFLIASRIQMNAIERVLRVGIGKQPLGRREKVHKRRPGLLGCLPRGLGVGCEVRVELLAVREMRAAGVFGGDRAKEHAPQFLTRIRTQFGVPLDKLHQLIAIRIGFARPPKRLVVAVEGEDHARTHVLQIFVVVGEPLIPGPLVHHVAGETHVAKTDVQILQLALQHSLHKRVVLHPIGKTVAVDGHHVVGLKSKLLSIRGCHRQRTANEHPAGPHCQAAGKQSLHHRAQQRKKAVHHVYGAEFRVRVKAGDARLPLAPSKS